MTKYQAVYDHWLSSPVLTEEDRDALRLIARDEEKKALCFGTHMSFGTAGLRAVMAPGTACMNVYTVAHTTQALARLVLSEQGAERGVVIDYDSRHHSREFAHVAAEVLAANGIRVYLFDGVRPTAELSFAIRTLGCMAGISITASHNPKQYNGYKAYWSDGSQLSPAQAGAVCAACAEIDVLSGAKHTDFEQAVAAGVIRYLDASFDEIFIAAVMQTAIRKQVMREVSDTFPVVYTPLHGAGYRLIPDVLRRAGLVHVHTVPEQMVQDGDFPTVAYPNPEYADAFRLGVALAEKVGSDLVIATDPDADRVGVMCRGADGRFTAITGNQMGALLLDYVIGAKKERGDLTADDYAVKSFVSTELANRIAERHGVQLYEVPTGFKYVGEVLTDRERRGGAGQLLCAFEESYGYLPGSYARDKDAVGAVLLICEMAAWYRQQGMSLLQALARLDDTYGLCREGVLDLYMEGLEGLERRRRVMSLLRAHTPSAFGGVAVAEASDFRSGLTRNLRDGTESPAPLSGPDVLCYRLQNGDKIIVRPSGTEPKIKVYCHARGENEAEIERKLAAYKADADRLRQV